MEGWTKAANESENPMNFDWDDYAKPGDLVDEGVYDNFWTLFRREVWDSVISRWENLTAAG